VLDIEESLSPSYHKIARALRAAGIAAEVFPEKRKLAQQFAYAERKGIGLAVIIGTDEAKREKLNCATSPRARASRFPSVAARPLR
jgi:histidyl-tRNA synthetase